jgi:hypothetical protein
MGDQEDTAPEPRSRSLVNLVLRTRNQVVVSAVVGSGVTVTWLVAGWPESSLLDDADFVASILLGLGSILALVSSITFGFLLHQMQGVTNEKRLFYGRFKDAARSLRAFLDELHEGGAISDSYDFHLGLVEELTLKQFPVLDWNDRLDPVVEAVIHEQQQELEAIGEFGRILRGFAYRVNDMEENVGLLFENWLRHLMIKRMLSPVVKAFYGVAAVIVGLVALTLSYEAPMDAFVAGFAIGLAVLTLFLIIELALVARREASELYEAMPETGPSEETAEDMEEDLEERAG